MVHGLEFSPSSYACCADKFEKDLAWEEPRLEDTIIYKYNKFIMESTGTTTNPNDKVPCEHCGKVIKNTFPKDQKALCAMCHAGNPEIEGRCCKCSNVMSWHYIPCDEIPARVRRTTMRYREGVTLKRDIFGGTKCVDCGLAHDPSHLFRCTECAYAIVCEACLLSRHRFHTALREAAEDWKLLAKQNEELEFTEAENRRVFAGACDSVTQIHKLIAGNIRQLTEEHVRLEKVRPRLHRG
ncbi:unnamed protein product, partial [Mesorhabditis spiculigera]